MRVLIACEFSGIVCRAFRERGVEAWSCDLESGELGQWHIQDDVTRHLQGWNLMIAHPPCTHLAISGARWFPEKKSDGRQKKAIDFFMLLANADIPRIAMENPVSIMSTEWRKPNQYIQPWQFGHGETKKTCLWLKGLPRLIPTNIVDWRLPRIHWIGPGPNRSADRSRTYSGIAEAIAEQWSVL